MHIKCTLYRIDLNVTVKLRHERPRYGYISILHDACKFHKHSDHPHNENCVVMLSRDFVLRFIKFYILYIS